MNSLVKLGCNVQKMSSREIAELCNKRHDNVMADIRKMLAELGLATPEFSGVYKDQQLIDRPCFNLPKRETLILVSGYSVELRAKIIDRWAELESQSQHQQLNPANLSRLQLIEMAMQAEQERIELEHQVEEMQPTVEAFERIAKADGSLCITDAAKSLQVRPKDLFAWLRAHQWIYKRTGSNHDVGYQDKVQTGYLEHKVTEVTRGDGSSKITEQVRITSKGLARLAKYFGGGLPA